jgi:hypothetical protein
MIKLGNLSAPLRQWLMSTLQLGPGIGDVQYLCDQGGHYHLRLLNDRIPTDHISFTPALAYTKLVADRNDVLLVYPGLYTTLAELDWEKDHTHLIGLGGPNIQGRMNRPNTMIYTNTEGVGYTIKLTGDNCQFHNVMLGNGTGTSAEAGSGANLTAANKAAFLLAGHGNYLKRVAFRGLGSALQIASSLCSSLEIGDGAGESEFDECIVGVNSYGTTRSLQAQGQLLFSANPASPPSPSDIVFKDTRFLSRAETATVVMVYFSSVLGTDRCVDFIRCHFDNYSANWAVALTQVFGKSTQAHQATNINLINCTHRGFTYWADPADTTNTVGAAGAMIQSNMPAPAANGGKMVTASTT